MYDTTIPRCRGRARTAAESTETHRRLLDGALLDERTGIPAAADRRCWVPRHARNEMHSERTVGPARYDQKGLSDRLAHSVLIGIGFPASSINVDLLSLSIAEAAYTPSAKSTNTRLLTKRVAL